jgi:hypothetical protein
MHLLGQGSPAVIDYLPYLPPMHLENTIQSISNQKDLDNAKHEILSHYFSLQKMNRSLARQLKAAREQKPARNPELNATMQSG